MPTSLLQKRTAALKAILKIMEREEEDRGGMFDSSNVTFNYRMNRIMDIADKALQNPKKKTSKEG